MLNAQCTCPVGTFCKHTAAVLRVLAGAEPVKKHEAVNPEVLRWLDALRTRLGHEDAAKRAPKPSPDALFYHLERQWDGGWSVLFSKGRFNSAGKPSALKDWNNVERAILQPPAFVREADLPILRQLWACRIGGHFREYPLRGELGEDVLTRLLACGRLIAFASPHEAFAEGEPLDGELAWARTSSGHIEPRVGVPGHQIEVIVLDSLWYLDRQRPVIGPLRLPYPTPLVQELLSIPPLTEADLTAVADTLTELAPELPPPAA